MSICPISRSRLLILFCTLGLFSCKKYLDQKPDLSRELPSTLQDVQAILDNLYLNTSGPYCGELAADNVYFSYAAWNALTRLEDRQTYIWDPQAQAYQTNWSNPYVAVMYANQALQTLTAIRPATAGEQVQWNTLEGSALFCRGFYFFLVAQVFAPAYDPSSAASDLGIPLRLTPDISAPTTRATVQKTYDQILSDLRQAAALLPPAVVISSRPNKAAAYAALARTCLAMRDYTQAGLYADSCLQSGAQLLDFNQLNPNGRSDVIPVFNKEVLFDCVTAVTASLLASNAKADSVLYRSYDSNDLRKIAFFATNPDSSHSFIGGYHGSPYNLFDGLATDEVYLTRAECAARNGNTASALADLNTLLQARWKRGTFTPLTAPTADSALSLVLRERRKELCFRTLRWTDLRRLNKDPRFAVTLTRVLNGQAYTLPPGDLRYTFLIPQKILALANMPQNPR